HGLRRVPPGAVVCHPIGRLRVSGPRWGNERPGAFPCRSRSGCVPSVCLSGIDMHESSRIIHTRNSFAASTSTGHQIAMALRAAYLTMHRQSDASLAGESLTSDQFVVLGLLAEEDRITQPVLVRRDKAQPE